MHRRTNSMRVSRTVAKPMLHSSCSPPSSPGSPRGFMSSLCTVQRRPWLACLTDTALKASTSRVAAPKRCRPSFPPLSMWIDCRDGPYGKPRARQRGHSPSSLRHLWRSISGAFDRSPIQRGVERRRPWCTARLRPPERHEPHRARCVATPARDPCRGLAGSQRV